MKSKAVVFMIFAMTLCACNSKKPLAQPPQGVQVQQVGVRSRADANMKFSAIVMPNSQIPLAFRVPGFVLSILQVRSGDGKFRNVGEGDRVLQGTILARLRSSEYNDKVQQAGSQAAAAQAAAQKAKLDFERASRLFESQSLTKPEYDAARAQFEATQAQAMGAQAQKSEANVALRDTAIRAPISGDVVRRLVEVGSLVGPGTPAFVIVNTDIVKITIGVPDVILRTLKIGTPVIVTTEAVPDRIFNARVSQIASAADPKTRNFDVEVEIPNRDHVLKAGMVASLQLASIPIAPVPVVPISAIAQSPDGKYGVFTITKGSPNVARFLPVDIGEVLGSEIEIRNGVTQGDLIVTNGATTLKDGQPIEVLR